jgi:16S rRNA (guanine966-N2)-methyltransferase
LSVPGRGVRPTMDRVKAAIFSMLGNRVVEARVLDLFAGAGGLAIEALSRGAASALFVERDREAARAIERNLARARLEAKVRVQDVFDFLRHATGEFDIMFADPPYERTAERASFTELLLENERIPQLLAPDGIFILEKRPDEHASMPNAWAVEKSRRYGATEVLLLSRAQ